MTCESFFRELGRAVEHEWSRRNYDERALPDIAVQLLDRHQPSAHVTPLEIADYALFVRDRGTGASEVHSDFGQPNINVFEGERFYIVALFWLDGSTTVHQHGFSGAFHVLAGGSVHTALEFTQRERLSANFKVGQLVQKKIEILKAGDTRPIVGGGSMIHSLFHLDYPSVTIVVRTNTDPGAEVQFDYAYPSVAQNPFGRPPYARLASRTLKMLKLTKAPDFEGRLIRYLRTCDARDAFDYLLHEASNPESEWVLGVLEHLKDTPYGRVLPEMRESLIEHRRLSVISGLRAIVTEREARIILGLLLNSRNLETFFRLLRDSFAGCDPKEKFLGALRSLAAAGIGFPENDSSVDLIGPMLDGKTDEEVVTLMVEQFELNESEMRPAILQSCAILRTHPLLSTVLTPIRAPTP